MSPRLRTLLLTSSAFLALGTAPAAAGPDAPVVVGGTASITGAGTANVTVNQTSNKAIINWNTFNIGPGETTTFVQPNSSSVALNRVTGGLGPSEIYGTLNANGRVFVINRDGVLVGSTGVINTAGFIASTADIANDDFMAGRYNFNIAGRPDASVVNLGRITATNGGFAALVAPGVRNAGTITATMGTVALASGNTFTLDLYGDKLIQLAPSDSIAEKVIDVATGKPLKSLVTNEGKLAANGGRVEITAAAARQIVDSVINNTGVIEANTVGTRAGKIVLGAATASSKPMDAPKQTVKLAGKISASGTKKGTKGGTVVVTGEHVEVTGAKIDVSGEAGGGKVMLGGDWGGGNPAAGLVDNASATLESYTIANASTLTVDATTVIDASAKTSGNGGKVILWSDNATTFAGTIFAKGGLQSGDGGFVEVSSKQQLAYRGAVDTRAPNGRTGVLLLDPENYYINSTGDAPMDDPTASAMSAAALEAQLLTSDVIIATLGTGTSDGDIRVESNVTWSSNNSLTLNAHRDIIIDDFTISNSGAGNLTLRADSQGTGTGTVYLTANAIDFSNSTGKVSIFYNPVAEYSGESHKYENPLDFSDAVVTSAPGQLTAYMLVNTFTDLQDINYNLAGNYALSKTINADNMAPIGSSGEHFTGILEGQGFSITNAVIAPTGYDQDNNIGLFAVIGSEGVVRNLNLVNFEVRANPDLTYGLQFVGTLAGTNLGTVSNVTATGTVGFPTAEGVPATLNGVIAGGLVGQNGMFEYYYEPLSVINHPGTITNSSAAVAVSVGDGCSIECSYNFAGGLAGFNIGGSTIALSSASGNIAGGANTVIGGLVGQNGVLVYAGEGPPTISAGTITASHATGNVTLTGSQSIAGGLAGFNVFGSTISDPDAYITDGTTRSYATGTVSGGDETIVGGLVGTNAGQIAGSYATGAVTTGSGVAGGFAGLNLGQIALSYTTTGKVLGGAESAVGGFVGVNAGAISETYSTRAVEGGDTSFVGGFAGINATVSEVSFVALDEGPIFPGTIEKSYGFGPVTAGNASIAAAFAALNIGSLDQTYGVGRVSAGSSSTVGGLVAVDSGSFNFSGLEGLPSTLTGTGVATNSYWDFQSTGVSTSAGGTGLNTATLSGGLPPGFDPEIWAHGSYPYLINLGPQNTNPLPVPGGGPNPLPSQELIVNDLIKDGSINVGTIKDVVDTTLLNDQQGQQGQQGQGGQGGGQGQGGGGIPGQLNVGPGRFFFIPPIGETRFVKDEVIIHIHTDIPLDRLRPIAAQLGLTLVESVNLGLFGRTVHQLKITDGRPVEEIIRALAEFQVIAGATPNYSYFLTQDTANRGDPGQYIVDKLQLPTIHRTVRGTNIPVAVIDSEVDGAHPDLAGGIASRFNATGVDERPHSHGTGMAGAIASHSRLLGVAPGARILAIRAFSTKAAAAESTTFNILKGLDHAIANNVRLVNMSFAGPRDPSLERAIKAASDRNAIMIAAAGNAGPRSPPLYPAADPNVIAVTATDMDDKLFAGANRGRHIAIAAPGVNILVPAPDGTYQLTTGTSVATAHISGVVALLLERNPRLSSADVRRILVASAKRLGPPEQFGAGLVDPTKALEMAAPGSAALPPPARTAAPTVRTAAPARSAAAPTRAGTAPRPAAATTSAPARTASAAPKRKSQRSSKVAAPLSLTPPVGTARIAGPTPASVSR